MTKPRKSELIARLEKRILTVSKNLYAYEQTLADAKRGYRDEISGTIGIRTRYDAEDVKNAQEQVDRWAKALNDYRDILEIVRGAD